MDIKELTSIVKENGIVGAGGAGFPTYAKLDNKADTIILNCAECEPLLKVHKQLLQKYAYEIMSTLNMIAQIVEADSIIVALKGSYTQTVEAVRAYSDSFKKIHIKMLDEVYPMGDEVVLIYETLGKVVPPGSIPINIGVAVFNVETIFNIYKAVNFKESVYTKFVTIAGEVNNPITIKVPIGMLIKDVIELAGGSPIKDTEYIMGGPMTGNIVKGYDMVTKTTNAVLVLPKNHYVIQKRLSDTSVDMKRAMSVCCQCEMCTDLCPRHQLGLPVTPHLFMRAISNGATKELSPYIDSMFCSSCGICEMYACSQGLSVRKLIMECKSRLKQKGLEMPHGITARGVKPLREFRKVQENRLIARLGLMKYDIDAPLSEEKIAVEQVKISLLQHIGVKSQAIVKVGDNVKCGEIIAVAAEGKLSIPVHASITGKVQEINSNFIRIKI